MGGFRRVPPPAIVGLSARAAASVAALGGFQRVVVPPPPVSGGPTVIFAPTFADLSDWDTSPEQFAAADGVLTMTGNHNTVYLSRDLPALAALDFISLRATVTCPVLDADTAAHVLRLTDVGNNYDLCKVWADNGFWKITISGRDDWNTGGQASLGLEVLSGTAVVEMTYDLTGPLAVGKFYVNGVLLATVTEELTDPVILVLGAVGFSITFGTWTIENFTVADGYQGV